MGQNNVTQDFKRNVKNLWLYDLNASCLKSLLCINKEFDIKMRCLNATGKKSQRL